MIYKYLYMCVRRKYTQRDSVTWPYMNTHTLWSCNNDDHSSSDIRMIVYGGLSWYIPLHNHSCSLTIYQHRRNWHTYTHIMFYYFHHTHIFISPSKHTILSSVREAVVINSYLHYLLCVCHIKYLFMIYII